MTQYEIMSLLMRLRVQPTDPHTVHMLYAETLARIVDRLTEDEMRRLLLVGAFLCHGGCPKEENLDSLWEIMEGQPDKGRLH